MTMWARNRIPVKVVELLVQEEAVLLDVKNKNGLKPEEVTQDGRIKELLREEHWRRARSEVFCWHLMTKLSIWCWCLRKTLFFIQDGARGGAFGATRTTRSWGAYSCFPQFPLSSIKGSFISFPWTRSWKDSWRGKGKLSRRDSPGLQ